MQVERWAETGAGGVRWVLVLAFIPSVISKEVLWRQESEFHFIYLVFKLFFFKLYLFKRKREREIRGRREWSPTWALISGS